MKGVLAPDYDSPIFRDANGAYWYQPGRIVEAGGGGGNIYDTPSGGSGGNMPYTGGRRYTVAGGEVVGTAGDGVGPIIATIQPDGTFTVGHGSVPVYNAGPVNPGHIEANTNVLPLLAIGLLALFLLKK